jgi:hypothetical protein
MQKPRTEWVTRLANREGSETSEKLERAPHDGNTDDPADGAEDVPEGFVIFDDSIGSGIDQFHVFLLKNVRF